MYRLMIVEYRNKLFPCNHEQKVMCKAGADVSSLHWHLIIVNIIVHFLAGNKDHKHIAGKEDKKGETKTCISDFTYTV